MLFAHFLSVRNTILGISHNHVLRSIGSVTYFRSVSQRLFTALGALTCTLTAPSNDHAGTSHSPKHRLLVPRQRNRFWLRTASTGAAVAAGAARFIYACGQTHLRIH
jgi:hypothetical protein